MTLGFQLLAWRRHRGFTQADLAIKAGIPRPYLSRLELDKVDPSLSLLRRLASGLNIRVGELIEELPVRRGLTNQQLDDVARGALKPSASHGRGPLVRPLARMLKERRAALGLYKPRKGPKKIARGTGVFALRRLRVDLGENQWQALLKRIDKHATFLAPPLK
jgi:DNA-binding XRE family transcriptional regulator